MQLDFFVAGGVAYIVDLDGNLIERNWLLQQSGEDSEEDQVQTGSQNGRGNYQRNQGNQGRKKGSQRMGIPDTSEMS